MEAGLLKSVAGVGFFHFEASTQEKNYGSETRPVVLSAGSCWLEGAIAMALYPSLEEDVWGKIDTHAVDVADRFFDIERLGEWELEADSGDMVDGDGMKIEDDVVVPCAGHDYGRKTAARTAD